MNIKMHFDSLEKWLAWMFGMAGGCIAYIKAHILLLDVWGGFPDRLLALLWAGIVACFTGGMGVVGKKVTEWAIRKIKKLFNH